VTLGVLQSGIGTFSNVPVTGKFRVKNKSPSRGFWDGRSEGEGLAGGLSVPSRYTIQTVALSSPCLFNIRWRHGVPRPSHCLGKFMLVDGDRKAFSSFSPDLR
jgi:hypothetical protein